MFEGFESRTVKTDRGEVFARVGGSGSPVLLLHGYPQTHVIWHAVVDALTTDHTVIVADLPGYGSSFRPAPTPGHEAHSKRALSNDLVQLMEGLGFTEFAVAGHDRGGRVAYRMALDHPERITALGVFDVVPTGDVWDRADASLAITYWHWSFLAQPAPLPEALIGANPGAFFDFHVKALGLGRKSARAQQLEVAAAPGLVVGRAEQLHRPELRLRDRDRRIDDLAVKLHAILLADQRDADRVQQLDIGQLAFDGTERRAAGFREIVVKQAVHEASRGNGGDAGSVGISEHIGMRCLSVRRTMNMLWDFGRRRGHGGPVRAVSRRIAPSFDPRMLAFVSTESRRSPVRSLSVICVFASR